jgi:ABC-2 type transport system permease protein
MVMNELRKWQATVASTISRYMAFKGDFFLALIAPSLVFIAINYNVWRAIYQTQGERSIGGFSMEQMLHYQCWSFIVALLTRSHRAWNLSEHIRLGRITSFLLYPFDAWKFYSCEFIAFQLIQCVTVCLSIVTLQVLGFLPLSDVSTLAQGLLFSLLVSVLWFVCECTFGLAAFWFEEVWVFRVVFNFFAVLFSGAFIPIELFPRSLQSVLAYTPFPFITSVPVHMFLGTSPVAFATAIGLLSGWILTLGFGSWLLWRRGLRLYTAAGI